MKPIEKPQFFALCETMSNKHNYYDALGSLQGACARLANDVDHIRTTRKNLSARFCPGWLLDEIAQVEMNLEFMKQSYIQDRIDEYERRQEQTLTELYKRYDIKED